MSWPWLHLDCLTDTVEIGRQGIYYSPEKIVAFKIDYNHTYLPGVEYFAKCRGPSIHVTSLAMPRGTKMPPRKHDAPQLLCTCGFYAWKTEPRKSSWEGLGRAALLQVELRGHVIEHERGWRAERMVVLERIAVRTGMTAHLHGGPWNGRVVTVKSSLDEIRVANPGEYRIATEPTLDITTYTEVEPCANYPVCYGVKE